MCVRPPGWVGHDAGDAVAALLRWATRAEELGLDGIFVGDRLLSEATSRSGVVYGATMLDPAVSLAAIAARTSRIRFGPLVLVLPYRHPLQVAKLTASLDALSQGRLVLGAGTGWNAPEFAALGIPRAERGERLEESIRLLRRLWTGEAAGGSAHYPFDPVSVTPTPVQAGGPPVWLGAFSPGSPLDWTGDLPASLDPVLDRAGRLADGWVPLVYSASGRRRIDPGVLGRAWARVLEAAERAGRSRGAIRFVHSDWIYVLDGTGAEERCRRALAGFFGGSWEEALATYVIGTPAEVVERLRLTAAAVDRVDAYVLTPLSGEPEQLELVGSAIAPVLRDDRARQGTI